MSKTLTVKQINNYICGVFDDEIILHDICVTGEIFEFKISQNNTFIVLKEDDNILECYKYGRLESFDKGAKVIVRGRIKFYPKGGRISLTISDIKYSGEGQYHVEFEKLKESLKQNGYFDNKNRLPIFIKRVALITSVEGAVIHDFKSVVEKSHGYIEIDLYNVSVQGDYSKSDIVSALERINKKALADVVVVARGGGSHQDLLPFNTEEIAKAVFNSKIPVISAVGHETDYTLCDFCSVLRAPTPSLAGESIVKINQSWLDKVYSLLTRAADIVAQKFAHRLNYVSILSRKLAHKNELSIARIENRIYKRLNEISDIITAKAMRQTAMLESKTSKLMASIEQIYASSEQKFASVSIKLDSLSPLKLMAGGYAKVICNGKVIISTRKLDINKIVKVALYDGVFTARITEILGGNKED